MTEPDLDEALKKMRELFGSGVQCNAQAILRLAMTGQPCDLTFFDRDPMLDVTIDEQLYLAIAYGAGPEAMAEKLNNIRLSNGETVGVGEVWVIYPMPKGGFTEEELANVDLALADEEAPGTGKTHREIISETYRCSTPEEEERYVRRWIAS